MKHEVVASELNEKLVMCIYYSTVKHTVLVSVLRFTTPWKIQNRLERLKNTVGKVWQVQKARTRDREKHYKVERRKSIAAKTC